MPSVDPYDTSTVATRYSGATTARSRRHEHDQDAEDRDLRRP